MSEKAKQRRPRKVIALDDDMPTGFVVGLPDDKMWAGLKRHLPALSKANEARLHESIKKCVNRLTDQRSNIQQGAMLSGYARKYQSFARKLASVAILWRNIHGEPSSYIRTHFDSLEAMAQEAKRQAANLRAKKTKVAPVGGPWQELVRGIAQCFREAGIDPTVNGRGYDTLSNSPSGFQKFMIQLNAELPALLREPTKSDQALATKIMRAMKPDK